MYARKFRTVVFTRRKILRFVVYFMSGIIMAVVLSVIHSKLKISQSINVASSNIYTSILESELPIKSEYNIGISEFLGFDIKDPQTILRSYSPLFDKVDNKDKTVKVQPTEIPQPQTPAPFESITADGGMRISNATSYKLDINELAASKLPFVIDDNGPQVLIVHTHTTESYSDEASYTSSDRTTDETKNIVAVGKVVAEELQKGGIKTVHDTTVHDYPSYNGAYTRALTTIKENLGKYPSIKVVLDVHRDGIVREDGTKVKVLTQINGEACAQVMIVAGSDASGLSHDNWRDNMNFASHIQKSAYESYPSLMRPINLREERFNTHVTKGSIILEIGSNGNTLEEAKRGARYAAEVICKVLKNK